MLETEKYHAPRSKKMAYRVHEFGRRTGRSVAEQMLDEGILAVAAEQDAGWLERLARTWARMWAREELDYAGPALDVFTRGYVRGFMQTINTAQRQLTLLAA